MPSALYFKLKIFVEDKTKIDLSCFHLYDDNTRVDQNATITTGFDNNASNIAILKNDPPIENISLAVNNVLVVKKSKLYIIWKFSSATNVNAFRIGTGSSEDTMVNKFSLSYSDDGSSYVNFINIGKDKKLSYPGPWQLTQLKPVGECFPVVLDRGKDFQYINNSKPITVGEDGRSINGLVLDIDFTSLNPGITYNNPGRYSGLFIKEIPGIFSAGKFYFEVSETTFNTLHKTNIYSYITLVLVADNTERSTVPDKPGSPAFGINSNFNTELSNSVYGASRTMMGYTRYSTYISFVPGYQTGFSIDFDNQELKYYNPTWCNDGFGPFNLTVSQTAFKKFALGTKFKLFIYADNYINHHFAKLDINVGQNTFVNALPNGFQPGLGPRWKEEIDGSFSYNDYNEVVYNKDLEPYNNKNLIISPIVDRISDPIILIGNGTFYIKGTVKREPEIENKRFIVQLFSISARAIIAERVVSSNGLYEFIGIAYGAYTITSIDLRTNTVSECIGPVYPIPINEEI